MTTGTSKVGFQEQCLLTQTTGMGSEAVMVVALAHGSYFIPSLQDRTVCLGPRQDPHCLPLGVGGWRFLPAQIDDGNASSPPRRLAHDGSRELEKGRIVRTRQGSGVNDHASPKTVASYK
ncbi:hypothetical protein GOL24_26470 [Sinorhizobium medicae]|nr:hypothetical protein [Sinorhizobium medicae]MDX0581264.1 hypothetical protein [Sinorhizobium medicae]MDX0784879.1 hypothetical protein [Sinorhizobium medicae]MDX1127801.1 hypothetical protein [Sinorhizobium medicae]MDX1189369.1 hypothetical protein [Sinorhizobium medicae]